MRREHILTVALIALFASMQCTVPRVEANSPGMRGPSGSHTHSLPPGWNRESHPDSAPSDSPFWILPIGIAVAILATALVIVKHRKKNGT